MKSDHFIPFKGTILLSSGSQSFVTGEPFWSHTFGALMATFTCSTRTGPVYILGSFAPVNPGVPTWSHVARRRFSLRYSVSGKDMTDPSNQGFHMPLIWMHRGWARRQISPIRDTKNPMVEMEIVCNNNCFWN